MLFILVTLGQKNFRGVEVQIFEVISCWENLQLELVYQIESPCAPFVHVFDYFESAFCPICLLCETKHSQFSNHTFSLNRDFQSKRSFFEKGIQSLENQAAKDLIDRTAALLFGLLFAFEFLESPGWCPEVIHVDISLHHKTHLRIVLVDMQKVVSRLKIREGQQVVQRTVFL